MKLFRKIGDICRFLAEFIFGERRTEVESASADIRETDLQKITDMYSYGQALLADGTEWARDREGNWYLFKADGAEDEAAMFELLKYLEMPIGVNIDNARNNVRGFSAFAAMAGFGLALPERHLIRACNSERYDPDVQATVGINKKRTQAKGRHGNEDRNHPCGCGSTIDQGDYEG